MLLISNVYLPHHQCIPPQGMHPCSTTRGQQPDLTCTHRCLLVCLSQAGRALPVEGHIGAQACRHNVQVPFAILVHL
jgi:hypothetical protein